MRFSERLVSIAPIATCAIATCAVAICAVAICAVASNAASPPPVDVRGLDRAREAGRANSAYLGEAKPAVTEAGDHAEALAADLAGFRDDVQPALEKACVACHGPSKQEARLRVDMLDPDLLTGGDVNWWLEVFDVVSNDEMPPDDQESHQLTDAERAAVIGWLASQIQSASQARRDQQGHSSFRRLTRYEYSYALQDLLGLPYDFGADLPPEPVSEDGFQNSAETLRMSATQFETYRQLGRRALEKATVRGERPTPIFYDIPMSAGYDQMVAKITSRFQSQPERLQAELEKQTSSVANSKNARFVNLRTGRGANASWSYRGGRLAWNPTEGLSQPPPVTDDVLILPAGKKVIFDLGPNLPGRGIVRVRLRASRHRDDGPGVPTLRLNFGFQASNNSKATDVIGPRDVAIDAAPGAPSFYEWDVPLSEVIRNPMRKVSQLGQTPNPTEYIRFENTSASQADVRIDHLQVIGNYTETWPPASHRRVFVRSDKASNELAYARQILAEIMPRVWRRPIADTEIERKLSLFDALRPDCNDFQETVVEVLATVLASPNFLYVTSRSVAADADVLSDHEMATRLALFLWCSTPDDELLDLASRGRLSDPQTLADQARRLLDDARSQRFVERFVYQWLGMQLLDHLSVDRKVYPRFGPGLKEAMRREPVALFDHVLRNNASVIDFLHADYAIVNERLAQHYGIPGVYGAGFRRVGLADEVTRGGLLTQAGFLAMNSDGKDSHPLKRGIWLLESLLNDPPPPPPAAVPEIDLADPEVAKMTLKQRIEDHRDDPACISCHAKIDPWGIAFENFDAVGAWRDRVNGEPVDATSLLFNKQKLSGVTGLKRFLLANRQDQFARAVVHKLVTFALGRPLTLKDRAAVDRITHDMRNREDRLADLVILVVTSELFRTR